MKRFSKISFGSPTVFCILLGLLILIFIMSRNQEFDSTIWKNARKNSQFRTLQKMVLNKDGLPSYLTSDYDSVISNFGEPDESYNDNNMLSYDIGKGRVSVQLWSHDLTFVLVREKDGKYNGKVISD